MDFCLGYLCYFTLFFIVYLNYFLLKNLIFSVKLIIIAIVVLEVFKITLRLAEIFVVVASTIKALPTNSIRMIVTVSL